MFDYVIYTADNCSWCEKAKELLTNNGMTYLEKNISKNKQYRDTLRYRGLKTVPQIYEGTSEIIHMGGYDDFSSFIIALHLK